MGDTVRGIYHRFFTVLSCLMTGLLVMSSVTLASCGAAADPTPDFRYRLTVEVDTPDGLKTGSSVIEVETSMGRSTMAPAGSVIMQKLRGEAVAVDLGDGRTLFALLRSRAEVDWAKQIMLSMTPSVRTSDGKGFEATFQKMLQRRSEIVLPAYYPQSRDGNVPARPMLVTFGDVSDPASVAEVDPDDLAATFGEGVTLKRITVQLTDDPVTTGIEERLEWLIDPAIMENPGWRSLPYEVRVMLIGLRAGKVGAEK